MVKVITPIGAVVEVDESVYQNNKHVLKKYEESTGSDIQQTKKLTKKDVQSTNLTGNDIQNTAMTSPNENK